MANGGSWRDLRLQPNTAFSRFPPVHRNHLEGQQRVEAVRKRVRRQGQTRPARSGLDLPQP